MTLKALAGAANLTDVPKTAGKTLSPTELARQIWGSVEGHSRSRGTRLIRQIARELFPEDAPGKGHEWHLTPEQVAAIRRHV